MPYRSFAEKLFYFLAPAALILALVNFFVIDFIKTTETLSMIPTLPPSTQMIVLKKEVPFFTIERGDVVIFLQNDQLYAKRVIAKGGDTISLSGDDITLNNQQIEASFVSAYYYMFHGKKITANLFLEKMPASSKQYQVLYRQKGQYNAPSLCHYCNGDISLREDQLFLMGDNRDVSEDSRVFGPVSVDKVVGKRIYQF